MKSIEFAQNKFVQSIYDTRSEGMLGQTGKGTLRPSLDRGLNLCTSVLPLAFWRHGGKWHTLCLSFCVYMSFHPERCNRGSVNVIFVSRFIVFSTFCLLLRGGQQPNAKCTCTVHPHSTPFMYDFLVCFTFTLHFPTSKNIYVHAKETAVFVL